MIAILNELYLLYFSYEQERKLVVRAQRNPLNTSYNLDAFEHSNKLQEWMMPELHKYLFHTVYFCPSLSVCYIIERVYIYLSMDVHKT